ncbi:hypothetical protein H8356DRAFT_1437101 [Neocallimastix lanati (nom. inval.)]|nr:hypothetical protein H8356DRAFT_1437101 [Neocallimastix sp. JGI-2020a]
MQLGEMQHFNTTSLVEIQPGEMQFGEMQLSHFPLNNCAVLSGPQLGQNTNWQNAPLPGNTYLKTLNNSQKTGDRAFLTYKYAALRNISKNLMYTNPWANNQDRTWFDQI